VRSVDGARDRDGGRLVLKAGRTGVGRQQPLPARDQDRAKRVLDGDVALNIQQITEVK
jgi:hypothetical protein